MQIEGYSVEAVQVTKQVCEARVNFGRVKQIARGCRGCSAEYDRKVVSQG